MLRWWVLGGGKGFVGGGIAAAVRGVLMGGLMSRMSFLDPVAELGVVIEPFRDWLVVVSG